jgi:hypothetical protein
MEARAVCAFPKLAESTRPAQPARINPTNGAAIRVEVQHFTPRLMTNPSVRLDAGGQARATFYFGFLPERGTFHKKLKSASRGIHL